VTKINIFAANINCFRQPVCIWQLSFYNNPLCNFLTNVSFSTKWRVSWLIFTSVRKLSRWYIVARCNRSLSNLHTPTSSGH